MKKIIIFGAGDLGQCLYEKYKHCFEVLFFVDNNILKPDDKIPVLSPEVLCTSEFDTIYIASASGLESIYRQLVEEYNILPEKINKVWSESHIDNYFIPSRIRYLENYAEYCYLHDIKGACAEVGVCRGAFAAEINRVFSDRKLYLFDTFEGFDSRDLAVEQDVNQNYDAINNWVQDGRMSFKDTSVELVMNKLPFPEQAIIRKGFFPETFDFNNDEKYVFVNLDTDLYQPIKDGLEIFYPRMVKGGIILVHDYYSMLLGVEKAVDEFVEKNNLVAFPVGDGKSIAIIKDCEN